jgi:hypothetical protein
MCYNPVIELHIQERFRVIDARPWEWEGLCASELLKVSEAECVARGGGE